MKKKIISLLSCGMMVLSLVGCTQIKDKQVLKEQMKSEIESYEDVYSEDEYKIYIKGNTLVMEEHEDSDNFYGWKQYNLGGDELVEVTRERSGVIKDLIEMKGGSENCHVKIIIKDFDTGEKFIVVKDGDVVFDYFE